MIKNFFKEYNSLINEMDTLYNADSASGYEPLMSDEKSEMSDSEIEEWEATVKAALLRRDSTLGTLTDSITSIMLQGVTVNGKTMYLSDFGINTLGYFSADDNERHAYHIDGDEDDSNTKSETDVLKSMIASDPDTVINFFTGLANSLYSDLTNKMSASTLSSAFTVYNDKELSSEYDDYTDKISDQEDKLNDLIDKWYSKFSTMETALSKLDSKSSSLSSLLGS
jgi:flagellar hook-associated protein 2